jgi:hypothetical protein
MQKKLYDHLLLSLPFDVVTNNILPYTYLKQPKKLLRDIRSFYADYSFLQNVYAYDYNYDVLFFDLLCFCNRTRFPDYNMNEDFGLLLKRLFVCRDYSYSRLNNMVFISFHRNGSKNIIQKIRFLWGLLRPGERTRFINRFAIEDFYS